MAPAEDSTERPSSALDPAGTTLGQLCAELGPELVEVSSAPRGLGVPVTSIWLHDSLETLPSNRAGGLVFLAGISPSDGAVEHLLRLAAAASLSAIACRPLAPWGQRALDLAQELGVALLTVPQEVGWGEIYELAHAAIVAGSPREEEDRIWSGLADLSSTVEALAAITNGSVTIDDMQWRVLAFSGSGKVDQMREASILNRRLPEQWLRQLRRAGVIEKLLASDEVIQLRLGESQPRRAIAIRFGRSVLGSIWVAGDELSDEVDDALRRAAPIAALQLMRQRVSGDVERRMRESALATLLRGGEASRATLEEFRGAADERLVIIVFDVIERSASAPELEEPRLIDLVTMYLRSYDRPALATTLAIAAGPGTAAEPDDRVYVLTSLRDSRDRAALGRITAECLQHTSKVLGVELRAGIGHSVESLDRLPEGRQAAEDSLRLAPPGQSVTLFEEVRNRALLVEIERLVASWRAGPSPTYLKLAAHDDEHGTEYVHTLRCLFDAFGNTAQAAERLNLHPNTIRYRIRRITEIAGLELSDGDARLALELTLRAQPGSATYASDPGSDR